MNNCEDLSEGSLFGVQPLIMKGDEIVASEPILIKFLLESFILKVLGEK